MIIDRIENEIAVIEDGDIIFELPITNLPKGAKEGSVIIYQNNKYILDNAAEDILKKRLKDMEKRLINKNKS